SKQRKAMRLLKIIRLRMKSLFLRAGVEQELDEELRYHLEREIDAHIASGMSRENARLAALREFQDFEQRREECRDMRGWNLLDNLQQDLRFAVRQLAKNKGFTSTAILMLALGMCASVAIFAFVDATLIRPLPYLEPSRLVGVYGSIPLCPRCDLSYFDYLDWKRLNKVFRSLEAYHITDFILRTSTGVEPAQAAQVSDGFFRALGVTPALGRDFYAGEDLPGKPHTVVLSYTTWRKRYGGKTDVLGRTVTLNDAQYVVIGVLPPNFQFAPVEPAEFWTTLDATGYCEQRRGCHNLYGIARLKDGVSVAAALADTKLIAQQLEKQYPDSNRGQGAAVLSLTEVIVGDVRTTLLVLLGGAGLLLLIACVNIASLLLARSESRRREMAVRGALGASRIRLIQQFVTEGLVLVAAGSVLGVASAAWAMQLLTRLIPAHLLASLPFVSGLGLNLRVSAFASSIALLAAVLFAVTPALLLSFAEMRMGLTEGSRGSAGNTWRRLGSKLVVVELATAMVLLVCAGLLGQSLHRLLHVDLAFQPDHLATLMVGAPGATYGKRQEAVALGRRIVNRVSSLPGVKSAGATSVLPVSFNGNTEWIRFVGRPYHGGHNEVNGRTITAGYFTTVGAKLLRGRYFTETEDASKPGVAIINQALARKYFGGEDPIGKQFGDIELSTKSIKEIIGIVDDIREGPLDSEVWPAEYIPFNQRPRTSFSLVVRTSQAEQSILPALIASIHEIDLGIVTLNATTMRERIDDSPSAYLHRSSAWLVGGFAAMALLLGVVGLYGVIAYSVGQRTREIGVRMALGAEPRTVYGLILKEAGWLTALGIIGGLIGSLAAATLMRKLLFGIRSWDVPTLVAVALVLAASALAASFIPARRAASVNPVDALHAE
ncbi:MAG TPA: ABC transporter permease, partial [Bryobacteraceae bacterium]|nr:ABC transporter permease [Bryobacteraceae bacterium]